VTVRRRSIDVHGAAATYREAGSGPVAVIAAGLGLSSSFYDGSYDAFAAAGIRLVVPDLPGWGGTPGPLTGLAPADTAAFLHAFADALQLRHAVWIGHSLGAQAVVELAARWPERAAGLVLAAPTGGGGRRVLLRQLAGLAVEATRTSRHVMRGVARDYLRTPPPRYFGTWLRHASHDACAVLPRVSCPMLIVVGDADPVCRPGIVERLHRCAPASRVAWVAGATHALPRGHASHFNAIVTAFVRES
jgi:2-hydroxy-6-oxonona-2,4-dienedioate hydrolase